MGNCGELLVIASPTHLELLHVVPHHLHIHISFWSAKGTKWFTISSRWCISDVRICRNSGHPSIKRGLKLHLQVPVQNPSCVTAWSITWNQAVPDSIIVSVYNNSAVCDKLFPTKHSTQDSEKFQFEDDRLPLRLVYVIDQIVLQVRRKDVCHFPIRNYQHRTNASFDIWRIRLKTCICKNEERLRNWPVNSSRSLRLQTWEVQLQSTDGFNIQRRILWRVCVFSDNRQCLLCQPSKKLTRCKLKPAPESKRISTMKPTTVNDRRYHWRDLQLPVHSIVN